MANSKSKAASVNVQLKKVRLHPGCPLKMELKITRPPEPRNLVQKPVNPGDHAILSAGTDKLMAALFPHESL